MRSIFLALLCAMSISSFAQSLTPAAIITTQGDSIRGELLFKDWDISPSGIDFRPAQGSVNPNEIVAFKIDKGNRIFERVRVSLKFYHPVIEPSASPVAREIEVNVFAEVIYSNQLVRLYSLGDENSNERFLIKMQGKDITELVNFSYRIQRNDGIFESKNPRFRAQLTAMFSDCEITIPSALAYQAGEIIRVLDKYSKCKGMISETKKSSTEGLINGGIMVGRVGVPIGDVYNPQHITNPVAGFALQILSRKNFNNRFVIVEAGFIAGSAPISNSDRIYLSLYGGTFFGRGKLQGLVFTGTSRYNSILDTGAGISYLKKITLVANVGLLDLGKDPMVSVKLRYHPRFKAPKQ